MAKIGTTGGFHVQNYLLDSRNGIVVSPIQAGKIYGPVAFPKWQGNNLSNRDNFATLLSSFSNSVTGYLAPKR